MNMIELIAWLIGIVLAMSGVGLGLLFQGKYLLAAENEKERIAENMKTGGIIWLSICVFCFVVLLVITLLVVFRIITL